MNQLDPNLLKIFAAEQNEHIARMRAISETLPGTPTANRPPLFDELLRRAHTLKGAARAVGLVETERLAHGVEEIFMQAREGAGVPDVEGLRVVRDALDRAEDILAWALGQRFKPEHLDVFDTQSEPVSGSATAPAPTSEPARHPPAGGRQDDLVRVDAGTIDEVIRTSSSVVIAAASETAAARRVEQFVLEVDETLEQYRRLRRSALPYLDASADDPRFAPLAEYVNFMDAGLARLRTRAQEIAAAQARISWDLQHKVRDLHQHASRARMTPAETVFGAFGAMARDLARQQGKEINFRAEGLDVQADRLVLQELKDPVMHLLRNGVFHGIEPPEERRAAGKPPAGELRLLISSRGDRLQLAVEDDGKGLDREALARAAVERGMLTRAAADSAALEDLTKLMFQPGFSTSGSVTELSGRGMGLSVVRQAAIALRGEVSVRARTDGGTVVSLSLPLSISTQHVVLVAERGYTFAVPASQVAAVRRVPLTEITQVVGQEAIIFGTQAVPLVRLADLLGLGGADKFEPGSQALHVVMLTGDGHRAAVVVERILDDREAIIKSTGLTVSEAVTVAGAIPLEDGSVAAVLSVAALLERFLEGKGRPTKFLAPAEEAKSPRILVVDDSITTRSVEKNILEAHGYDVDLAVDGIEALEKMQWSLPDLVIADIAMPRMDGFELLEKLKSSKETSEIPVILVTSLEAREEQQRGLSLGADAYIVKRKFDQRELIATVRQIL